MADGRMWQAETRRDGEFGHLVIWSLIDFIGQMDAPNRFQSILQSMLKSIRRSMTR
jgi:hypothetical protein